MKINILGTKVHVVVVVFGALCVLMLLGCIGVISWGGWKINQQDEAVADLGNQTKHLETKDEKLEEETENLGKKVENLNEKLLEETENLSKKVENLNETLEEETENLGKKVENLNEKLEEETENLGKKVENLNEKLLEETENLSKKVENLNETLEEETENLGKKVENLNEKLEEETENLSKKVEKLSEKSKNETERLNQIIQLILKSISYAADQNYDSREYLLCKTGWIYFNNSCYFLGTYGMNWEQSRQFCQNKSADLVVIDSEQEQEFIYNNINTDHWLGLRSNESNWVWIDGRNDKLGSWNPNNQYYEEYCSPTSSQDCYASMRPWWNYKTSWFSTYSSSTRYPLCEQEAFKLSLN